MLASAQSAKAELQEEQAAREADKAKIESLMAAQAELEERYRAENEVLKLKQAQLEDRNTLLLDKYIRLEDASDSLRQENEKLVKEVSRAACHPCSPVFSSSQQHNRLAWPICCIVLLHTERV